MNDEVIDQDQSVSAPLKSLRNETLILSLGILSIVLSGMSTSSLVLNIVILVAAIASGAISLIFSIDAINEYRASEKSFKESSYKNVNGGKICAIIGLSLVALSILQGAVGVRF